MDKVKEPVHSPMWNIWRMKKKIILLIVFVPVHYFFTLHLMQRYLFNYNPNVDTSLFD